MFKLKWRGRQRGGAGAGGDARDGRARLEFFPSGGLPDVPREEVAGWPFPAHLDNPACAWLQALKGVYADRMTYPASLSPEAGQLLHAIALNVRPRVAVETGVFLGISTIWLAAALELAGGEGVLHCVDDFRPIKKGRWRAEEMLEGREGVFRANVARAGLSGRVVLRVGESAAGVREVVREVAREGKLIDFAFLDADHTPAGVRAEFESLQPGLATGGYVVVHDIYPEISRWKGPRMLMDKVNGWGVGVYECLDVYLSPANFGLGVIRRVG